MKLISNPWIHSGGYSHAPDKLTYGVDMKHVRWGGILQVWNSVNFPILWKYELEGGCVRSRVIRFLALPEDCSCILGSGSSRDCYKRCKDSGSVKFGLLYLQNVLFPMVCKVLFLSSDTDRFYFYMLIECCAFTRIVACCILVVYLSLVYGIYVPDWEFRVQNTDSSNYGKVLTVQDFSTLWWWNLSEH